MRKYVSLLLSFLLAISFFIVSYAQEYATVAAETIDQNNQEEQLLLIYINNNPGIMGFKLRFDYSPEEVEIISIQKGEVTQKGNFNDNIGTKDGCFDVMWNNTSEVATDGTIAMLKLKVLTEKPFEINVSYSQEDTFNGEYEDVLLSCNNIFSSNSLAESNNNEIVSPEEIIPITDEQLEDIITAVLKNNDIDSLDNIKDSIELSILSEVNAQIENTFNQKDYYKDFDELSKDYKVFLKKQLIIDVDSLNTEKSPETIINDYKEENDYSAVTKDNVNGLVEIFQNEGLDDIYLDYLTDDELEEIFNQVLDNYESINKKEADLTDNAEKLHLYILIAIIVFIILCCISFIIYKEGWKRFEK